MEDKLFVEYCFSVSLRKSFTIKQVNIKGCVSSHGSLPYPHTQGKDFEDILLQISLLQKCAIFTALALGDSVQLHELHLYLYTV